MYKRSSSLSPRRWYSHADHGRSEMFFLLNFRRYTVYFYDGNIDQAQNCQAPHPSQGSFFSFLCLSGENDSVVFLFHLAGPHFFRNYNWFIKILLFESPLLPWISQSVHTAQASHSCFITFQTWHICLDYDIPRIRLAPLALWSRAKDHYGWYFQSLGYMHRTIIHYRLKQL